jgi:adenylate cyclase
VVAIPLALCDRLIGVLSAESRDPMKFGEWHEAYLEIIGNQIAQGIDRMVERSDDAAHPDAGPSVVGAGFSRPDIRPDARPRTRRFTYYRNDDAIFVDDEYLIRNLPARILWKVLTESQRTGRTEFSNREMRLDESLGLPPVKDNLESRLILLRHRLKDKCPDLQIVPTARGRFALRASAAIEMVER